MGGLERLLANKEEVTPFVGTGATIAVLPKNPHARWDALLADGIRECEKLGLSTAWAESTTARLQFGDLITYLSVADEVSRRLGEFGEWNDWVKRTVGSITVPGGSAMHTAICELNRIVLTTNYDRLLEESSDHKPLHWQQIKAIRSATQMRERSHVVIHLHGVATSPKSVVLGSWQYQELRDDITARFWTRVLLSRRLLFIGCGTGLHDPNIGPALQFVQRRASSRPGTRSEDDLSDDELDGLGDEVEPDEHYILVRGCDLSVALEEFRGTSISPVAFGADYSDLGRFLIDFAANQQPRPSQNVHDYLAPPRSTPKHGLLDLAGPAEEALQAAIDLARSALQALGQVERRSTLPYGVERWAYADQLFIHERTAASVVEPIKRLQTEATALILAVQKADLPMGLLTGQREPGLARLFDLVNELAALCNDLGERVGGCLDQIRKYSKLTDDYRNAVDALLEAKGLADNICGTVERLPHA